VYTDKHETKIRLDTSAFGDIDQNRIASTLKLTLFLPSLLASLKRSYQGLVVNTCSAAFFLNLPFVYKIHIMRETWTISMVVIAGIPLHVREIVLRRKIKRAIKA
jgi:hypothetical protein